MKTRLAEAHVYKFLMTIVWTFRVPAWFYENYMVLCGKLVWEVW